jgi:hypothetical protein
MESLRGKTVRWTFGDGPVAGMLFEHVLNEDGTVVWRAQRGFVAGATLRRNENQRRCSRGVVPGQVR